MDLLIKEYFKEHDLPKPVSIRNGGRWVNGEVYSVTCGLFKIQRFAVYTTDGKIVNVRQR